MIIHAMCVYIGDEKFVKPQQKTLNVLDEIYNFMVDFYVSNVQHT